MDQSTILSWLDWGDQDEDDGFVYGVDPYDNQLSENCMQFEDSSYYHELTAESEDEVRLQAIEGAMEKANDDYLYAEHSEYEAKIAAIRVDVAITEVNLACAKLELTKALEKQSNFYCSKYYEEQSDTNPRVRLAESEKNVANAKYEVTVVKSDIAKAQANIDRAKADSVFARHFIYDKTSTKSAAAFDLSVAELNLLIGKFNLFEAENSLKTANDALANAVIDIELTNADLKNPYDMPF